MAEEGRNRHFAFANGPKMQAENSGQCEPNSSQNSMSAEATEEFHHQMSPVPGEVDESRVCLLDTACTACMHSKTWRLAYERHLPADLKCEETTNSKTFHFADGSSTQATVWRIPIMLGGRRGEVLSAEVTTGSTPLLLSVTSMESLQMDLFLRERRARIGALGVDVEILQTRTKHRAIDLTRSEGLQLQDLPPIEAGQGPTFRSPNDDLFISLAEEATFSFSEAVPHEAETKEVEVKLKHETALKLGSRGT